MIKKLCCILGVAGLLFSVAACGKKTADTGDTYSGKKVKAGFIYVGPIGDFGWTYAHEISRKELIAKYPWLETIYVENIPEGDSDRVIDRLVNEEKCDIIFATSFGYMDSTINAGKKYPDKIFMHCAGYKREKNVGTYFAELYQAYYLNGLMAGALSKTDRIGYVAAHPIPEVIRHINAFAIGVKEVNPSAKVYVKWLFSWYDPAKAREAAESLIAQGCDTLAFEEDSVAVIEVGQSHTFKGHQIYTFSHYSPMQKFGPDSVVSGQLVNWTGMYDYILNNVNEGKWTNEDMWWRLKEKAVALGGEHGEQINKKFVPVLQNLKIKNKDFGNISVYDLVMKRLKQMEQGPDVFDPFTGPVKDQKGIVRIKTGNCADHDMLWTMDWFAENVEGKLPESGK
ncbi:MAG: Purine-binding protein precursor [Elusimicrobia bacterium ADurb.Bin231]|nr:MAG: Purine-binding protein precursor [Elusimicrobia bacterium ADurb.Bin231]